MGTVPTAPVVSAGAGGAAADFNLLGSVATFLSAPPQCLAYHSVAQTLTTAAWTLVSFTSEAYDAANVYDGGSDSPHHDNTTNPSRIYVRTAGKYEISGQITFVSNATNARQSAVRKNSAGDTTFATGTELTTGKQSAVSGIGTSVPVQAIVVPLVVGDYVEMFAWQNSGGNLDTLTGQSISNLSIRWVSS